MGLPYTLANGPGNNPDATQLMANFNMALLKDGTVTPTANIPMGSNKLTGLAAGTANGDALRYEQLLGLYLLLTGGTLSGPIAMGSNKITGIANGTIGTDVAAFGQITAATAGALASSGGTLSGNIIFSPTTKGITGTTTNDAANTGTVGEYVESIISSGSGVTLSSGTAANITSISLTAGDWDVFGLAGCLFTAASMSLFLLGSGTISATDGAESAMTVSQITQTADFRATIPTFRYSLASTTTVYLIAHASFSGTVKAFGRISARRMR